MFRDLPPHTVEPIVKRVLITLGGADPESLTSTIVAVVMQTLPDAALDVVLGPLFGDSPVLEAVAAASDGRVHLHCNVADMMTLMARADLAVSGGGQTLFELAAAGLPAVAICLAPNQQGNIGALDGVTLLGAGSVDGAGAAIADACINLARDYKLRARLSQAGQQLVDGRGAIRAARAILTLERRATSS